MTRFFALAAIGALWGIAAAFVFRRLTNRARAAAAIDRIVAHALELPLFIDEPAVVFRAARDLLVANARLLGAIWLPCALMAGFFALLYSPLNRTFGFAPLPVNQPTVVTAKTGQARRMELRASRDIAIETPPVRAIAEGEVSWRVRPVSDGPQELIVPGDPHPDIPWPEARYLRLGWVEWFIIVSFASAIVFGRARVGAALVVLVACGTARAQTPVILISVDTLRADHLSCYGYRRVQTPHIDSLASGGTLFSQIDSQIPLTLPSHTTLLTSTYPFVSKVEENGSLVPPGTTTLASVLKAHGYKTAAFIGSIALDRRYGLDQGFDFYDSPFNSLGGPQNPYSSRVTRNANLVIRAARQWVDRNRDQPFFAFIHLYDLHLPYELPGYSPVQPSMAGYDAELEYVDAAIGRFIDVLSREGLWRKAIVVLLADHGESLGEHGESGHGYFIYESTIHVPLLIHWPEGQSGRPGRVNEPGGLIDVAPTILEALRIRQPESFQGKSLFAGARPVLSESVYARDAFGWAGLRSIRTGGKKYIQAPKAELYDLTSDSKELRNIVATDSGDAGALKQRLNRMAPGSGARRESASAGQQALRSLGYIAGPAAARSSHSNVDPKDRIREFEAYTKAVGLMYVERAREAVPMLKTIVASDPGNYAIRVDLGHAYLDVGRPADAIREWDAILARDPAYTPASEAEAFYWMEKLDFKRAADAFHKTLRVAPRDYEANFAMAIVDEKLGDRNASEQHRRVVCEISPSTPGCSQAKAPAPH